MVDSDENEQYVYPYSGNNTETTTTYHMSSTDTIHRITPSSLYRPQSTRSFINNASQQDLMPTKSSSGFLGDLLRPILFKSKSDSKGIYKQQQREEHFARPKLRSYVMDHPYNQTKDWFDGKHSPPLYQSGAGSRRKLYTNYGLSGDGGYTTDDEEAQHLLATQPLPTRRSQQQQQQQHQQTQPNRRRKQTNAW